MDDLFALVVGLEFAGNNHFAADGESAFQPRVRVEENGAEDAGVVLEFDGDRAPLITRGLEAWQWRAFDDRELERDALVALFKEFGIGDGGGLGPIQQVAREVEKEVEPAGAAELDEFFVYRRVHATDTWIWY
jgi:hypothetical protein